MIEGRGKTADTVGPHTSTNNQTTKPCHKAHSASPSLREDRGCSRACSQSALASPASLTRSWIARSLAPSRTARTALSTRRSSFLFPSSPRKPSVVMITTCTASEQGRGNKASQKSSTHAETHVPSRRINVVGWWELRRAYSTENKKHRTSFHDFATTLLEPYSPNSQRQKGVVWGCVRVERAGYPE